MEHPAPRGEFVWPGHGTRVSHCASELTSGPSLNDSARTAFVGATLERQCSGEPERKANFAGRGTPLMKQVYCPSTWVEINWQ
jgi:hypothetical protein